MHHIRRRLSPSLIVAIVALFVALAGTAAAANTVFSSDIVDGQVRSVDVANNDITGTDVAEGTLSVPAMGCQQGKVVGFARVKGGSAIPTFYTNASAVIDITNNCSGNPVEVRRSAPGVYFVRFVGNGANLALVVGNEDGASTAFSGDNDNVVTVGKITSGSDAGSFRVDVQDLDSAAPDGHKSQDGKFTIMLF